MTQTQMIALAAGGTGGHVFPAIAVARVLQARGITPIFITDSRGAKFLEPYPDFKTIVVKSGTVRKSPKAFIKGMLDLVLGTGQAVKILRAHKINAVIGFGGYPSFPGVFGGWLFGLPIILHEQNAVLGKANIFLARLARGLCLSFPPSPMHPLPPKILHKTVLTGNPVRTDVANLAVTQPYQAPTPNGLFHLLIMGGSLGASVFAEVVPNAIALLPANLQKRLVVTQQCRSADMQVATSAYAKTTLHSLSLLPFIQDVAGALAGAHLVICRAGASTVAELAACGRPALFVPYPHHGDAQQSRNADVLVTVGGAWVMEESGFFATSLSARLEPLLQDPSPLAAMAAAAQTAAQANAAEKLADCILKTL